VSLFRWLFPRTRPRVLTEHNAALAPGGMLTASLVPTDAPAPQMQRPDKSQRATRREALYMHAGILSGGYKFKVLALDQAGMRFLVMVDLNPEYVNDPAHLGEIEVQLIQSAHARFRILVTAVYWRANGQVAPKQATPPPATSQPRRAPLDTGVTAPPPPAPLIPQPILPPSPSVEPVEVDEIAAFRQALLTISHAIPSEPQETGDGQHAHAATLTGFEDTKVPEENEPSDSVSDQLSMSTTQYGSLPS